LGTLLSGQLKALKRLGIRGLLRKRQFSVLYNAPRPGTLGVKLTAGGSAVGNAAASRTTTLASGRRIYPAAGRATVKVKLTRQGVKRLRHARLLRVTLTLSFDPTGGSSVSRKGSVTLRR
jgi:hypothetical protein